MNWARVIQALENEWDNHRKMSETLTVITEKERDRHLALADLALMLHDCLQHGLSYKE